MASIINRRGKYYSRVQWYDESNRRCEKQIPLKTDKKSTAVIRNGEVEGVEDTIKGGENWSFPWMQDGGKKKLIRQSITEAVEIYLSVKRIDGVRQKTIEMNELALNLFMNRIGQNTSIEIVAESHIDEWRTWSRERHSPNTTNIYLAKIKTFLKFCYKKGYLKREIDVVMVKADKSPPMYLSEEKLRELFSCELIDEHYRKAFLFYALTGCRKAEPFEGVIAGDWLIITPDVAKAHTTREVQLNPVTKSILIEMRERHDARLGTSGHGSKSITSKGIIDSYSQAFKRGVRALGFGEHKLRNLRDTYAVRRWIETGDIHFVSKEIGHASVTMTQKYADFNLRRLTDDFPSLGDIIETRLNKVITNQSLINLGSSFLQIA